MLGGAAVVVLALAAASVAAVAATRSSTSPPVTTNTDVTPPAVRTYKGVLLDGTPYQVRVPAGWNGTLVLYSHGYVPAGGPSVATDVPDQVTGGWLLAHRYAVAGSAYFSTGWAVEDALKDQSAMLPVFDLLVGRHPDRTIAWGDSLGGMITAGLIQLHPEFYAGGLPMCGVLAGSVAVWNQALDSAFAFKQLVAPDSALELVNITNRVANVSEAEQLLDAAQRTPEGRARLALSAALGEIPGWFDPTSPEPAASDVAAQELNQYHWMTTTGALFAYNFRAELEQRAHGNVSWNTAVDYHRQLAEAPNKAEVEALYRQAGLDLNADLDTLNASPRISPNPFPVSYLRDNIVLNGDFGRVPVLTLHTTGDGLVVAPNEQSYSASVARYGRPDLLLQEWVNRAGHCAFTPAETIAAFETLVDRIDTGKWNGGPSALETRAKQLTRSLNITGGLADTNHVDRPMPPAFVAYRPAPFLRPFDVSSVTANG